MGTRWRIIKPGWDRRRPRHQSTPEEDGRRIGAEELLAEAEKHGLALVSLTPYGALAWAKATLATRMAAWKTWPGCGGWCRG